MQEPEPFEKYNWLINLQYVRGELEMCSKLIERELAKSSKQNEYAYFTQAEILKSNGKLQEALTLSQECLKVNPSNPNSIMAVGNCLQDMKRFKLAVDVYLEAERLYKGSNWQVYYNIGKCLLSLGDVNRAKEYAVKSVQISKIEISYLLLIQILILNGDLIEAVATSDIAIENCPDSTALLSESGVLHLKLSQIQEAYERFKPASDIDPFCSKALLGLGCICQSYEDHEAALVKYKLAISNTPDSSAIWNNIGVCFNSKGKPTAAINCLKRALWEQPLNWQVLYNLGLVHLQLNQNASAFNFLCGAIKMRPDVAMNFNALGYALATLKDHRNALLAYEHAIKLKPTYVVYTINALISGINCEAPLDRILELTEDMSKLIGSDSTIAKEHLELAHYLINYVEKVLCSNEASQSNVNQLEADLTDAILEQPGFEDSSNLNAIINDNEDEVDHKSTSTSPIHFNEDEV